jgi:DNA-binding MarR family transcriptional regulator
MTTARRLRSGVLEVVPASCGRSAPKPRRHRTADLSVPQFRTLAFIDRNVDASLSDVAEHIGLTLPSMSKIVEGLVTRKLVTRQTHPVDRRRMTLALTARGQNAASLARGNPRLFGRGFVGFDRSRARDHPRR